MELGLQFDKSEVDVVEGGEHNVGSGGGGGGCGGGWLWLAIGWGTGCVKRMRLG